MGADLDQLDADDLDFRFVTKSLPLAFTATVGERWRLGFERLRDPGDLIRWLHMTGLVSVYATVRVSESDLEAARDLREAIYGFAKRFADGSIPEPDSMGAQQDVINSWACRPSTGPVLTTDGRGWVSGWVEPSTPDLLAHLAREAVSLFSGESASSIRECDSPECALLYLDTSRGGRRRWCSMDSCGARAKMAAYRERRTRSTGTR